MGIVWEGCELGQKEVLRGQKPPIEAKLPGPVSHQLCDRGQSLNFSSLRLLRAKDGRCLDRAWH